MSRSNKKKSIKNTVFELAEPIISELGLILWDVQYVKEGSKWYLRLIIDSERGINIDDCERVSIKIDPLIEEAVSIPNEYYFEVSSPGINRSLTEEFHFKKYLGKGIVANLIRPLDGKKRITGILRDYKDKSILLETEENKQIRIFLADTSSIKVNDDIYSDI